MCPQLYLKIKINYIWKLSHLTRGGGKSQGKFAAGWEVNPGWRNFCRAQEERRLVRHERRHLDFVRGFSRFRQLDSKRCNMSLKYILHK